MLKSLRLSQKISLLALVCVLPLMSLLALMQFEQRSQQRAERDQLLFDQLDFSLRAELDRQLDSAKLSSRLLAQLLSNKNHGSNEDWVYELKALASRVDFVFAPESIFVVNAMGRIELGLVDASFEAALQRALTKLATQWAEQSVLSFSGDTYLLTLSRFASGTQTRWLLYVTNLSEPLAQFGDELSFIPFNYVELKTAAGVELLRRGHLGETGEFETYRREYQLAGQQFYLNFSPAGAEAYQRSLQRSWLLMLLLLVLFCLALAFGLKRILLNRIKQLNRVTGAFAQGDYEQRANINGADELAQLGNVINSMCAEISQAQLYLKKMVEVRTRQAKQAAERLQAILSSVSDAIISISETGEILSFNRAAEKMFGYAEQDALGKSVNMLMPFHYSVHHDRYVAEAGVQKDKMRSIRSKERELEGKRQSGESFPVSIMVARASSDGEWFFTGVLRDLTEQRATERKLAEKERLLNTAIHTSSQAFAIVSPEGYLLEVNEAMCHWLNYDAEELLKMSLVDIVAQRHRTAARSGLAKMREGELRNITREEQYIKRGGVSIWGLMSTTAVLDEDGGVLLFVTQISDIDQSKALALELERRNLELERSNADLDQFAYIASHDLKSPLNAIKKIASWIEEDSAAQLNDSSRENLQLLKSRADRMMTLLNDLLLYSRVARFERKSEFIDLNQLCLGIFDILDKPDDFELQVEKAELNLPRVPLELVLRNLMSNAIKHHDQNKGWIKVSLGRERRYYVIRVADNGPGIQPELQNKALEMFQTLKPRDSIEGSGMGLALVKKTIEHFGGHVEIESDGSRGTTVVLYWPVQNEALEE